MIDFKYKIYMTDLLKLYGENKTLTARWVEQFEQKKKDTRTGDEVAADVIQKLGLHVVMGDTENDSI